MCNDRYVTKSSRGPKCTSFRTGCLTFPPATRSIEYLGLPALTTASGGCKVSSNSADCRGKPGHGTISAPHEWAVIRLIESHADSLRGRSRFGFRFVRTIDSDPATVIPFWTLVQLVLAAAVVCWIQPTRRFSLRTLLITTTLVAMLLGAMIYAVK
jgi:hypothetical protein